MSEVPGEVRLFRYVDEGGEGEERLDSATRIYRAVDASPAHVHLVTIERLVAGRSYAAEVHFPDGSSRHRVRFQIPERARIEGLELRRGRNGEAQLEFTMPFAVDGHIRQGPPDSEADLPLPGQPATRWEIPLPSQDPFEQVTGLYLDLEGAAGWAQTFGPYDFPGLDGEVRARLEELDVAGILSEIEAARTRGGGKSTLATLQDELRKYRIPQVLDQIRGRAGPFFRSEVAFERKLGLFHALQKLAPIDFYAVARNLPALLNVERFTKDFLSVTEKPRFEGLPGVVTGDFVAVQLVRGEVAEKAALMPLGVDPRAYQRGVHGTQIRGVNLGARAEPLLLAKPRLPAPLPEQVTLVAQVANFHPDYYLKVRVNGELTLLMNTPNPAVVLGAGEVRSVQQVVVRRSAELPTKVLRPGENKVEVTLHGFGPVSGGPAWVHQLDVYYKRGGR